MKILYVTHTWAGLSDLVFEGAEEAKGMPGFIEPLKRLKYAGNTVDILLIDFGRGAWEPSREIRIAADWLKRGGNIQILPWKWRSAQEKAKVFLRTRKAIRNVIRSGGYHFVYAHGPVGAIATWVAEGLNVPVAQRLYGTILRPSLRMASFRIALNTPLEYSCFRTRKSFLLVTNDGTGGDKVYQQIGKRGAFQFEFWLNGVSFPPDPDSKPLFESQRRFLFYPARIDGWKRQALAVQLLERLDSLGHHNLDLVFAGHISDPAYFQSVMDLAKSFGLEQRVQFVGAIPRDRLLSGMRQSQCTLSLYENSNLGNVAIEALAAGALLGSLNDGSLDGIVENGISGILGSDIDDLAQRLGEILLDSRHRTRLSQNASQRSRQIFPTWEARANREIDLINSAVKRN